MRSCDFWGLEAEITCVNQAAFTLTQHYVLLGQAKVFGDSPQNIGDDELPRLFVYFSGRGTVQASEVQTVQSFDLGPLNV